MLIRFAPTPCASLSLFLISAIADTMLFNPDRSVFILRSTVTVEVPKIKTIDREYIKGISSRALADVEQIFIHAMNHQIIKILPSA